jgi:hypothetical protein
MAWYYWLVVAVVGLFLLDRFFLFLEERGYLYWRKKKSSVSGVSAFLAIDVVFTPGKQHVIEQIEKDVADEEDGQGDKKP